MIDPTYFVVAVNSVVGLFAICLLVVAIRQLYVVSKLLERLAQLTESLVRQNGQRTHSPL